MTSPNIVLTSPKKVGRCHKTYRLLPNKLGEVMKSQSTSPKKLGEAKNRPKLPKKLGDVCEMGTLCPFEKRERQGHLGQKGKSWEMS